MFINYATKLEFERGLMISKDDKLVWWITKNHPSGSGYDYYRFSFNMESGLLWIDYSVSANFYLANKNSPPTYNEVGYRYCGATYNFNTKEYTETSEAPFEVITNESKTYLTYFKQEGIIEGVLDFSNDKNSDDLNRQHVKSI